jgi:hypothetical protein
MTYLHDCCAMKYTLLDSLTNPIAHFATLDAAYRYILDNRLHYWSLFEGEEFVTAADTTVSLREMESAA